MHKVKGKKINCRSNGPVDGLVGLDEDRVTLVHVGELRGLVEPDGAVALRGQGVRPAAQLADAHDDDLGLIRLDRRRLVDLDGLTAVGHPADGQLDVLHASKWSLGDQETKQSCKKTNNGKEANEV